MTEVPNIDWFEASDLDNAIGTMKRLAQTGSTFTAALRKLDAGWRVTAWAWAKGSQ